MGVRVGDKGLQGASVTLFGPKATFKKTQPLRSHEILPVATWALGENDRRLLSSPMRRPILLLGGVGFHVGWHLFQFRLA